MTKVAVVLLNLGAPGSLDEVRPFLYSLFSDPAVLRYPTIIRKIMALLLTHFRLSAAKANYALLGGKSPLLENTQAQADALKEILTKTSPEISWHTFVCMRHSEPSTSTVIKAVKKVGCSRIILLPLYPQFSTTTTASALKEWDDQARKLGLSVPTRRTCCYPRMSGFVRDLSEPLEMVLSDMDLSQTRVLFVAHGLPQSIVQSGDPYVWQVEQTARAIVHVTSVQFDWRLCYQSRVGPVPWTKPYFDDEIKEAGSEGKAVVVVPISFVSEHSETLVELDHEGKALAEKAGVTQYIRLRTVGTSLAFMEGLVQRTLTMMDRNQKLTHPTPACPKEFCACYPQKFKTF